MNNIACLNKFEVFLKIIAIVLFLSCSNQKANSTKPDEVSTAKKDTGNQTEVSINPGIYVLEPMLKRYDLEYILFNTPIFSVDSNMHISMYLGSEKALSFLKPVRLKTGSTPLLVVNGKGLLNQGKLQFIVIEAELKGDTIFYNSNKWIRSRFKAGTIETILLEKEVFYNMRSLQVTVETIAFDSAGAYPLSLSTIQKELPKNFINPFDSSTPALVVSTIDPPNFDLVKPGQVVYVPSQNRATYKIYGKGKYKPLDKVLTPGR